MENNKVKQEVIEDFIRAYNLFDVEGMLKDVHEDVKFENISNGQVDLETFGIEELRKQAEQAKTYFTERKSTITGIGFIDDRVEVDIDYIGILAKDLPNGLKAGDTLKLKGKSIYRFKGNEIISIQDIS